MIWAEADNIRVEILSASAYFCIFYLTWAMKSFYNKTAEDTGTD
jgi:hypothetical protein